MFWLQKIEGERGCMETSLYMYNAQYHGQPCACFLWFSILNCQQICMVNSSTWKNLGSRLLSVMFTGDLSCDHAIVSFLSRAMLSYSHSAISIYSPQYSATKLLEQFRLVSAISVSVSLNYSSRWYVWFIARLVCCSCCVCHRLTSGSVRLKTTCFQDTTSSTFDLACLHAMTYMCHTTLCVAGVRYMYVHV